MRVPLELELLDGPALAQRRWRLVDPFRIGRAAGSELDLLEPSVSRRHALIEADAAGWLVRDCGSRLGTRLNELPLSASTPAALRPGDILGIGPWRFRVETGSAAHRAVRAPDDDRISLVSGIGNLPEQRLALLLRYAGVVAAARDEHMLADTLAEYALLGSGYARAAVLWRCDGELTVRSQRPEPRRGETPLHFSRSLVASAEGGEVARLDAVAGTALNESLVGLPLRRALCAGLVLDGQAEAFLYLDSDQPASQRHADAPSFCHALARLAALALANLRRLTSEREHAALAADLARAREVQRRLLPPNTAELGGVGYALHLHPGRQVAGDVVDVFLLPDGRVAAMLGDVSGAGLGAGLEMASVQSFLRAELDHDGDPARAAARLNAHLCLQASGGRFVTLWLGIFDAVRRICRFVDAGHGHALRIVPRALPEPLLAHGDIPLGIEPEAAFHAESLTLMPREILLLHSDGAIEQCSPDRTAFGREGLIAAVARASSPQRAVADALAALREHAQGAAPDDDMTLLALGWSHHAPVVALDRDAGTQFDLP
ncbi:MAG TPA: SpoIIE family protein phosphatase [Rhodanobacteraceae bacterium]|nr:SpoIIE family protein phosphatase [Rhodanobacteraceae bacterium]